jgi:hypothetical protein
MEMDIEELDKLPDNRPSGFWKLSWFQVLFRIILWAGVVFVNEKGWVNPHHENFIAADFKMEKQDLTPILDWLWAKQIAVDKVVD